MIQKLPPRPAKPVTTPATREPRHRVPVPVKTVLSRLNGGEPADGWLILVNTSGAFVQTRTRFKQDEAIGLQATLPTDFSQRNITVNGWIAYDDGQGVGIQFDRPDQAALAAIRQIIDMVTGSTGPGPE